MKTMLSLLVLSASLTAFAERPDRRMVPNMACTQQDGEFVAVSTDYYSMPSLKKDYRTSVQGTPRREAMDCGIHTAAVYDGDSFQVLDREQNFFRSTVDLQKKYAGAEVVSGMHVSLLYDGSELIAYNGIQKRFDRYPVAASAPQVYLSAGGTLGVFIDGEDLVVYDAMAGTFKSTPIERDAAFPSTFGVKPVAIAGRSAVLAYDGRTYFTYCASQPLIARTGASLTRNYLPFSTSDGATISLMSSSSVVTLNTETCQLSGL